MTADHDRNRRVAPLGDAAGPGDPRGADAAEDSSFAHLRENIIEALRILSLRRWTFFIPFCITTCAVAIGSHWITRTYRATTVIERRDHPVLMNLRQTAATGEFSRFFRPTLVRDIKSLETMMEVVENLKLVEGPTRDADGNLLPVKSRELRRRAAALIGGVNAQVVQKAEHYDEISISFEGPDSHLPKRIVNELKDVYARRMRATLIEMLTEGMAYFQGLADARRTDIARLEEEILRFEAEYLGVDPTNPGALKLKLTSLEADQEELGRSIQALAAEVEARQQMISLLQRRAAARQDPQQTLANLGASLTDAHPPRSSATQALEKEAQRLQDEIHDLQLTRRMTDLHPDVVERRTRIARLREQLKEQYLADARSANRGAALSASTAASAEELPVGHDMELIRLRLDLQDREGRLAAAQSRLRTVESDIARHRKLQQNVFHYRQDYQAKADELAQARKEQIQNTHRVSEIASILNADESQRGVSFTVRTEPAGGSKPVRPQAVMILLCALLAGIAVAASAVLLKEVFDQTYHTARQITRSLGIAILETVDEIVTSADRARLFRRRVIYAPAIVTVMLSAVGLCCGAAYLSLANPQAYQRVMNRPRHLWSRVWPGAVDGLAPQSASAERIDPELDPLAVTTIVSAGTVESAQPDHAVP